MNQMISRQFEQESLFTQKIGYLDEEDLEILQGRPLKNGIDPLDIVNLNDYDLNRRN